MKIQRAFLSSIANTYPLCINCANVIIEITQGEMNYTCGKFRRELFINAHFIPDRNIKYEQALKIRANPDKCGLSGKYFIINKN